MHLAFNLKVVVEEVSQDSPAYLCGVRPRDIICACALAVSKETEWKPLIYKNYKDHKGFHEAVKKELKKARENNKPLVLDILRSDYLY